MKEITTTKKKPKKVVNGSNWFDVLGQMFRDEVIKALKKLKKDERNNNH